MNLKGKNALVTGASRGIGRGCAIEMGRAGANVAINYYSHGDEAEAVAEEIRAFGGKAITLQGDVSNRLRVEEMVAETAKAFGQLDLFVSNAVYSDRQLMLEADLDGDQFVFEGTRKRLTSECGARFTEFELRLCKW